MKKFEMLSVRIRQDAKVLLKEAAELECTTLTKIVNRAIISYARQILKDYEELKNK